MKHPSKQQFIATSPLLAVPNVTAPPHQRPVYQLHIIRRCAVIAFVLWNVNVYRELFR